MKITKTKLKQIIKEELSVVLNEQQGDLGFPEEEAPPAEWRVGPDLSPEEKQEQIVFEKEHYPALSDKVQGLRDRYGAEARIIEDPPNKPVVAIWMEKETIGSKFEDHKIYDSVDAAEKALEVGGSHWSQRGRITDEGE
jgi:hypothetical protein